MATYHCRCEVCGSEFKAVRSATQKPPRFCSKLCRGLGQGQPREERQLKCEHCGEGFSRRLRADQKSARFCSYDCYWSAGGPAENIPNVKRARTEGPRMRRATKYLGRVDGKPAYMIRARWVWNQAHPSDPVGEGDHIHHIDLDPRNDDPANLAKYTAEEHAAVHAANGSLAGPPSALSKRMKAYHQANPGKARKGLPKPCPVCGVEFYRPPSAKAVTCSYECMGKLRSSRSKPTP